MREWLKPGPFSSSSLGLGTRLMLLILIASSWILGRCYKELCIDSQSLRGDAIVASLIVIPHCTGWFVSTSTLILFPSTLGLSLISLTTYPARWSKCNIKCACKTSVPHHFLYSKEFRNSTSNYTTNWCSTVVPGLEGRVGGVMSGNVIFLLATKIFRMFLSSPKDVSKIKICEYMLSHILVC